MYCGKCGMQIEDDNQFCTGCGSKVGTVMDSGTGIVPGTPASSSDSPAALAPARSGIKMKIVISSFMAVLIIAGGFWGWNTFGTEARVQAKLDLAVKYLSENDYEKAVLAFNDAIKIDPKEVKAYQGLARTYTIQGKFDDAKSTYDKGLAAVAQDEKPTLQLSLAGMYIDQGQLEKAEQAFQELVTGNKNNVEAYWGLAMVYQQKGDNAKAEAALRQAVENNPNEYRAYNTLALYLKQNGKTDEAFNNLVKSLSLEMNQQEAYLILSDTYKSNWNALQAKTSLVTDKQLAAMLQFYGYYASEDYQKAINIYNEKLDQQTANQKARLLAALAMLKVNDKTGAQALIAKVTKEKLNGWLLSDLGRYYLEVGDQDKAKDNALKALQAQPANLEAVALLQTINSADANAKVYAAQALLYNWKPVAKVKEELQKIYPSYTWKKLSDEYADAKSIRQTRDGGYILTGNTNFCLSTNDVCKAYLTKYDEKGNKEWSTTYQRAQLTRASYIQTAPDGGYIGLANGYPREAYVFRTDSMGRLLWDKALKDYELTSIQPNDDGSYIAAGSLFTPSPAGATGYAKTEQRACLIRIDDKGEPSWIKTYEAPRKSAHSARQTTDGGFIFAGLTDSGLRPGTHDIDITRTDVSGSVKWGHGFSKAGDAWNCSISPTRDKGYIVAYNLGNVPSTVNLLKLDQMGDSQWEKSFSDLRVLSEVQQTTDGGYVFAGFDLHKNAASSGKAFLLKTNSLGNQEWINNYKGYDFDSDFCSVQQTADGGYIMAGTTWKEPGDCYPFIIKTDMYGSLK